MVMTMTMMIEAYLPWCGWNLMLCLPCWFAWHDFEATVGTSFICQSISVRFADYKRRSANIEDMLQDDAACRRNFATVEIWIPLSYCANLFRLVVIGGSRCRPAAVPYKIENDAAQNKQPELLWNFIISWRHWFLTSRTRSIHQDKLEQARAETTKNSIFVSNSVKAKCLLAPAKPIDFPYWCFAYLPFCCSHC